MQNAAGAAIDSSRFNASVEVKDKILLCSYFSSFFFHSSMLKVQFQYVTS